MYTQLLRRMYIYIYMYKSDCVYLGGPEFREAQITSWGASAIKVNYILKYPSTSNPCERSSYYT